MPNNNQGVNAQLELFGRDQYAVHKCPKCGALGTIVENQQCCRIAAMVAADLKSRGDFKP